MHLERFKRLSLGVAVMAGLTILGGCDRTETASTDKKQPGSPAAATGTEVTADKAKTSSQEQQTKKLTVIDAEGLKRLISESAEKNQVVVIDFWATWCVPCIEMFPAIHEGVEKLGPGVRLITVTLDSPDEEAEAIAFLTKNHALKDAYMMDTDPDKQLAFLPAIGKNWTSLVVPALFVYGKDGKLAGEFVQGVKGPEVLEAAKEALARP